MKASILIVDDDDTILDLLRVALSGADYQVRQVKDANSAYALLQKEKIDLVLLDHQLPGISGLSLLELIKKEPRLARIPVIMVTFRGEKSAKVKGLETGADDYVVKPFNMEELLARIMALLRRSQPAAESGNTSESAKIKIDFDQREVRVEGKRVTLTPIEYNLLSTFIRRRGMVLTLDTLADVISQGERDTTSEKLYVYINRLREKLGKQGRLIESIRGIGYKFAPED